MQILDRQQTIWREHSLYDITRINGRAIDSIAAKRMLCWWPGLWPGQTAS